MVSSLSWRAIFDRLIRWYANAVRGVTISPMPIKPSTTESIEAIFQKKHHARWKEWRHTSKSISWLIFCPIHTRRNRPGKIPNTNLNGEPHSCTKELDHERRYANKRKRRRPRFVDGERLLPSHTTTPGNAPYDPATERNIPKSIIKTRG